MEKIILAGMAALLLAGCCQTPETVEVDTEKIVVDNILARRSVRDFTGEEVSQEQLETIMKCAVNAPSAMNRQPWAVRVIRNPEMLDRIRAIDQRAIYNAPVVIVVAGDKNSGYARFDCGLLTQNIVLAAEAMDIGTVIVGSALGALNNPECADIKEALDLPDDYEMVIAICLGHKNERPDARPRDESKVKYIR